MKKYTDYMDNIKVDAALHEKIMQKATKKPAPQCQPRPILHYVGILACAAVLMLCVWTIPGLLNSPYVPSDPGNSSVTLPGNQQGGEQPGISMSPDWAGYALSLNKVESYVQGSIDIPGHFWHELTAEQKAAVLPGFSFPISATAHYRGDGSLFQVAAHETDANGGTKMFNDLYTMTKILFAPDEVIDDVVYEYDPKTSDVGGIPVVAGVFDWEINDGVALYIASFKIDGIAYNIKLYDSDNGRNGLDRLTELVNTIIRNGTPDVSVLSDPAIPELRNETLTLDEAYADPDFGAYLPHGVPSQFSFDSAQRFINQESNSLFVFWYTEAGYDTIMWSVSKPTEADRAHLVSADERKKYDLSLYPFPLADSIPAELWEYVNSPVFQAEELSLDVIKARAYLSDEQGDSGWRVDFSVLYDDVIVSVNSKGISPKEVWEMFTALR
jgi:hypothetical protein